MFDLHELIRNSILQLIDWVYPVFRRFMPLKTFRYAACGGANTVLDIFLFSLSYHYLFKAAVVEFGWLAISPHIASFLISFLVTFPIGFYLSRYVVFQETTARKRNQLFRYFMVVLGCVCLNYFFLKFFVEYLQWTATVSKVVTTFFVVIFSYLSQKNFTFKAALK